MLILLFWTCVLPLTMAASVSTPSTTGGTTGNKEVDVITDTSYLKQTTDITTSKRTGLNSTRLGLSATESTQSVQMSTSTTTTNISMKTGPETTTNTMTGSTLGGTGPATPTTQSTLSVQGPTSNTTGASDVTSSDTTTGSDGTINSSPEFSNMTTGRTTSTYRTTTFPTRTTTSRFTTDRTTTPSQDITERHHDSTTYTTPGHPLEPTGGKNDSPPKPDTDEDDDNNGEIWIVVTMCLLTVVCGIGAVFLYTCYFKKLRPRHVGNIAMHTRRETTPSIIEIEKDTEEVEGVGCVVLDSTPIPKSALKAHICKLKTRNGMAIEYRKIAKGARGRWKLGEAHMMTGKNRYRDVLPYDSNRVKLAKSDVDDSDYINASFVRGYKVKKAFIAAQGPTENTVDDFWRMIWDCTSPVVVMLTSLVEQNIEKCTQYWPQEGASETYGKILVQNTKEGKCGNITTRTFKMSKGQEGDQEEREMVQLHAAFWEDMGTVANSTCVLSLRRRELELTDRSRGPTIVHCSAGIGRTGTYIAMDYLLDEAADTGEVDVMRCVNSLRDQRVNMVQTTYQLIYEAVLEGLFVGCTTSHTSEEFPAMYQRWVQEAQGTPQVLHHQVEVLEVLKPLTSETDSLVGMMPENLAKNRTKDILPVSDRMVLLKTVGSLSRLCSCYINAVLVDGYAKKNAMIATQMPLPNTTSSFWQMILENQCPCIVMLNQIDEKKSAPAYWPQDGATAAIDHMKVKHLIAEVDYTLPFVVHQFMVSASCESSETHRVSLLVMQENLEDMTGTSVIKALLKVVAHLNIYWSTQDKPLVIHCLDGANHTGLFCGILNMVDMMRTSHLVDIYQTVKHLQQCRPQFISGEQQYVLLHEAAYMVAQALPKISKSASNDIKLEDLVTQAETENATILADQSWNSQERNNATDNSKTDKVEEPSSGAGNTASSGIKTFAHGTDNPSETPSDLESSNEVPAVCGSSKG